MSYGFKNSITFTAKKAETHDTALEGGEMLLGRYHRFPRFHSIRFNLWLTFVSMTVVMLLIMWVYELIFYSTIYVSLQENEMLTSGNEFAVRYVELAGDEEATEALITEYAADRRRAGMSLTQAAVSAAKARLRPVLMTVLTCVLGMLPLVFSTGAGANGNSTLGTGVVGGMIVGTLALLFLVPTLFIVFQTLQEKVKPLELDPDPQWSVRAEVEEVKNEKEE